MTIGQRKENGLARGVFRLAVFALALALAGGFAQTARAGCGVSINDKPTFVPVPQPRHILVSYKVGSIKALDRDDDRDNDRDRNSIVGMWKFTFTAQGNSTNPAPFNPPDGATLDVGFVQWHSDGTEMMNSGRDPASQSFCMGVFKSVGPSTYKLNHFALSWDATGRSCSPPQQPDATGCFEGPTNIQEEITLNHSGNHYAGTVKIIQYDPSGIHIVFELTGTVSADRITPG
jgi:hypothetical protein